MTRGAEALEKEIAALRKINRVLMERVESAVNSTGNDYAIFERNILLQRQVEARTAELEQRNRQLASLLEEQRRIVDELNGSEAQKKAILNGLSANIILVDRDLTILWANQAAASSVQRRAEDLVGRTCHSFWNAEDRRCENCSARQAFQTGKSERKLRETPDGRIWDERGEPVFDGAGNIVAVVEIAQDITDCKRTEEALRAKTDELERYFTSALDLLCIADMQGRFSRVKQEWERVLGYRVGDLENRTFLEFVHPDDRTATREAMAKLAGQEDLLNFTNRYRCKDGSYRFIEWRATPQGDLVYAAARDVTGRMDAEAELRAFNERLRTVLDSIGAFIYIADMQTYELLFVNEYGKRNWTDRALLGQPCWKALQGREGPCPFCTNDRLLDAEGHPAGVWEWEFRNSLDGRWYDLRDCAIRWSDGRMVRMEIATDITGRKQAEDALRESEARFKALHNASFGGIAIHDHGLILDCNQGLTAITGYAQDELIGMDGLRLISPKSLDLVKKNIAAQYEKPYDAIGVRKNGDEYPLRLEGRKIPYRGKEVGVVELRDITAGKQAEAALRASESRFKTLVDNATATTEIIDVQGRASYVSSQVEAILGYSPAEIQAMESVFDRIHPEDLDGVIRAIRSCLPVPESKGRAEYRYRHKDGRWIWLEATGSNLLHNPSVEGLFLIIQDISARKQAEAALREREGKLSALFASMTEMVVLHEVVLDELGQVVNYRLTDCNRAFSDITGISREAAVGRLATEVYGTPVPPYLEEYSRVGLSGEPLHFETYFPPMDKHFSISVVSPGKNRFATISTDITDSKKIQHVIASKNKELEQLVYVASHDLRSPLVNVDGYGRELEFVVGEIIQILEFAEAPAAQLEALLRAQLPDVTGALRHIRNSTRQMDALLKGLLKLSRMGRAALSVGPLDMDALMARVVSTLQFQIRQAGADLRVGDLPPCRGDAVQVAQVFANLIGNALKFREPSRPCVVAVGGAAEPGRCVYWVEDNGIGIPPEHREKIFELFQRLDPAKTEGEGLGLTIVRQILGRLEGEIRVESTPGEGSRFLVSLPKAKSSQEDRTETMP